MGVIRYNTNTGRFGFYQSLEEAGTAMPVFTSLEELENCPANTSEMVYFYNQITGEGVNRFSDKKTGARRIWKAIQNGYNGELNGKERIVADTQMRDQEQQTQRAEEAAQEATEAAPGEAPAGESGEEADSPSDQPEGPELAKKEASKEAAGTREAKKAVREAGKRGRKPGGSSFAGKIIVGMRYVNPRRPGTHGFQSYEIIRQAGPSGISYEDYVAKGGRTKDLQWDKDHGTTKVL